MKIRTIVVFLIFLPSVLYLPLVINVQVAEAASTSFLAKPISWLAAGDSYSSGQGLTYRTGKCAQGLATNGNLGAWPIEAANALMSNGLKLIHNSPKFVACTGATTDEFFTKNDNAGHPEWNPSMGKFDLVTFTFGGDNVGFSKFISSCIFELVKAAFVSPPFVSPHCPSQQTTENAIKSQLAGPDSNYGLFLKIVAKEVVNTGGNIVVLGYPDLIESPSLWNAYQQLLGMCQGITESEATEIRTLSKYLNSIIEQTVHDINSEAINGVHLTFVDVNTGNPSQGIPYNYPNLFEPSQGVRHNLCSAQEWLNGITAYSEHFNFNCFPVSCASFHPNQGGNTAMATLFEQVFPRLDWTHLTTPLSTPQCSATLLFQAAVAKEHFNPDDPSYASLAPDGNNPGAYDQICDGGWAWAFISRPNVGITDGGTLFHSVNNSWVEVAQTGGNSSIVCGLVADGVPQKIASVLQGAISSHGQNCPPPTATAISGGTVALHVCPTDAQFAQPPVSLPATVRVNGPLPTGSAMQMDTDTSGGARVLAPASWQCSSTDGADGSTVTQAWPPTVPAPAPGGGISEGVSTLWIPACVGCIYDMLCPYLSAVVLEAVAQAEGPCGTILPADETTIPVNADTVEYTMPANSSQTFAGTQGVSFSYSDVGIVEYLPPNNSNPESAETDCILPTTDSAICVAVINNPNTLTPG